MIDFNLVDIRVLDVIDVIIVAYLIYLVYKLLRGTAAFNIFIGAVLVYAIYRIVYWLDMKLLKQVLGIFVTGGVLFFVIVFQPEVRRFLLMLGNTLKGRLKFVDKLLGSGSGAVKYLNESSAEDMVKAVYNLSKTKTGGLIVVTDDFGWKNYASTGVELDADISSFLIESIFFKNSPLHDGAIIISGDKIKAASCVVAVSQKKNLSNAMGLRHRAAIGVTENTNALSIIISEETGKIKIAQEGKIQEVEDPAILKQEILNRLH